MTSDPRATSDELESVCERVLAAARAPECEVHVSATERAFTRFAVNQVTTSGVARVLRVSITSRGEGRSATVRLGDDDPARLIEAVRRSEALWRVAPRDPEWVGSLGPQKYPLVAGAYFEETARASPEDRAAVIRAAVTAAKAKGLVGAGFLQTHAGRERIANKRGNAGAHANTRATFTTTQRTRDGTGSGWAAFACPKLSALAAPELSARAAEKAVSSAQPRPLPPGQYTVLLEPAAVNDLLSYVADYAFDARRVDEGRSQFAKPRGGTRLGERLFDPRLSLRTDPFHPLVPGTPFARSGLPAQASTWIDKGVLARLSYSRYWAMKKGRPPLPVCGTTVIDGGEGTPEQLLAGTERALLVTRFWYIRLVNPLTLELTGLTRDGVWLVENGKLVHPVNNFRFNMSPLRVLSHLDAFSRPVSTGDSVVPAMRIRDFAFTSKSDAV